MKMATLISLVSDQTMPNIIAAVVLKPERMAFLVTQKFIKTNYRYTLNVIKKKLPQVQFAQEPYLADAFSIESARQACLKAIVEHEDSEVIINITGGTKLMSIGAFQSAVERNCSAIYVETNQSKIIYQHNPLGKAEHDFPTGDDALTIKDCVAAQGKYIADDELRTYTERELRLSNLMAQRAGAMGQLARKVQIASNQRLTTVEFPKASGELRDLVNVLKDYGLLKNVLAHGSYRRFTVDDGVEGWLTGRWFEAYVFDQAMQAGFDDVKTGVNIYFAGGQVYNEVDVMIAHNARLTLVSCKTGSMHIEHLDALVTLAGAAGGLFSGKVLVTNTNPSDILRERAKALRGTLFGRNDLMGLSLKLKEAISR